MLAEHLSLWQLETTFMVPEWFANGLVPEWFGENSSPRLLV